MTTWWICWQGHRVDYPEPRYAIEINGPQSLPARVQVCKKHLRLAVERMLKVNL